MTVSAHSPQPAVIGAHGAADQGQHSHGHAHAPHHHAPAHTATDTAAIVLPFSLIRASLSLRLGVALVLSGLIWFAVYLVLAANA